MATINGDEQDNILSGTPEADLIRGLGGNDDLSGLGASDELFGGAGNDVLHGGDVHDFLYGEGGDDQLFGDEGDNSLIGGEGADRLDGGAQFDYARYGLETGTGSVIANLSESFVYYDPITDRSFGPGEARDTFGTVDTLVNVEHVVSGNAPDRLFGNEVRNFLAGQGRNDIIIGAGGDDWLIGDQGDDQLFGGSGKDELEGRAGDDLLNPGSRTVGTEFIYAGGGRDVLQLDFREIATSVKGRYLVGNLGLVGEIGDENG